MKDLAKQIKKLQDNRSELKASINTSRVELESNKIAVLGKFFNVNIFEDIETADVNFIVGYSYVKLVLGMVNVATIYIQEDWDKDKISGMEFSMSSNRIAFNDKVDKNQSYSDAKAIVLASKMVEVAELNWKEILYLLNISIDKYTKETDECYKKIKDINKEIQVLKDKYREIREAKFIEDLFSDKGVSFEKSYDIQTRWDHTYSSVKKMKATKMSASKKSATIEFTVLKGYYGDTSKVYTDKAVRMDRIYKFLEGFDYSGDGLIYN